MTTDPSTVPGDTLEFGEPVFDADGNRLGTIRGVAEEGFFVTTADGMEALSIEHVRSGHEFGEAELMWRCLDCGELDTLEHWPDGGCPSCGAPKESLYYWTED